MASPPSLAQLSLDSPSPPPPLVPPRFRPAHHSPTTDDLLPSFPPFAYNPSNAAPLQPYPLHLNHHIPYSPPTPPAPPGPIGKKQPRAALPPQWLDPDARSLSPPGSLPSSTSTGPPMQDYDLSSAGGSPPRLLPTPQQQQQHPPFLQSNGSPGLADDDIIPTAIVIKNIPFNVKRETLLDIIASLSIPTPYAFNYHLDALGAFRGLAFANFRQAADADAVVAALNGFDVQGRKLRVEYKKVLQAGEKERIEREKALRRMRSLGFDRPSQQQQQIPPPMPLQSPSPWSPTEGMNGLDGGPPGLGNGLYPSQLPQLQLPPQQGVNVGGGGGGGGGMSSSVSMPLPTVSPPPVSSSPIAPKNPAAELDMNDPSTLDIYSRILVFKEDPLRDELAFSRSLTPRQRRTVHLVAQKLGVFHYSVGEGEERYAVVTRDSPDRRQAMSRPPDPPSLHSLATSLRLKKSMPSLRPSPSPSSSSPSSHSHSQAFLSSSSYLSPTAHTLAMRRSNSNLHTALSPSPTSSSSLAPGGGREREHFATISTATIPRRASDFGALYGTPILPPIPVPPVPPLPVGTRDRENGDSPGGSSVVRQPRGPSVTGPGFVGRSRSTQGLAQLAGFGSASTGGGENGANGNGNGNGGEEGLEATTHQPLEI